MPTCPVGIMANADCYPGPIYGSMFRTGRWKEQDFNLVLLLISWRSLRKSFQFSGPQVFLSTDKGFCADGLQDPPQLSLCTFIHYLHISRDKPKGWILLFQAHNKKQHGKVNSLPVFKVSPTRVRTISSSSFYSTCAVQCVKPSRSLQKSAPGRTVSG